MLTAKSFARRNRYEINASQELIAFGACNITALQKMDELRGELARQGIVLATARAKWNLWRFFNPDWGTKRRELYARYRFDTIKSAVRAFHSRAKEGVPTEPYSQRN